MMDTATAVRRLRTGCSAALLVALVAGLTTPRDLRAQQKGLSMDDIAYLVTSGAPTPVILSALTKRCLSFEPSDETEARLREVKAPAEVISGVQDACIAGRPVVDSVPVAVVDTGTTVRVVARFLEADQVTTKPIPEVVLGVSGAGLPDTVRLRTNFEGLAAQNFKPGTYQLVGRKFVVNPSDTTFMSWSIPFQVPGTTELIISNVNAKIDAVRKIVRVAPERALAEYMQPAVFTVWGTSAKASAFLVDTAGLLLTSARLWTTAASTPNEDAYVQIDSATKVRARVLAIDTAGGRDVAVLAISMARCGACRVLRLADSARTPIVSVQDKVLLGSPPSARVPTGYTTGLVSRVSGTMITTTASGAACLGGGPVLAEDSTVVGISNCGAGTTGSDFATAVPATAAESALGAARAHLQGGGVALSDSAVWLYPKEAFPAGAYAGYVNGGAFNRDQYEFDAGPWRVFVMTPPVVAWRQRQAEQRGNALVDPIQGWPGWAELHDARRAAVVINVTPKEFKFPYYKTDETKTAKVSFGDMRLLRGETAATPIERARLPAALNAGEYRRRGKALPMQGAYVFRDDEFAPSSPNENPSVLLEITGADGKVTTVTIPPNLVRRVQSDFAVYRMGSAIGAP